MFLYLVTRDAHGGYDTYSHFVCVAPDEATARNTHPNGQGCGVPDPDAYLGPDGQQWYDSWVKSQDQVTVQYLGVAALGSEPGVVCASYHAG